MPRPAFPLLALLTAGTALGGLCLPAVAQTSVVLDTVTVEADGGAADGTGTGTGAAESATGPVNGYVAKRTSTGSKTDAPLVEVPQSVSVVGREEIDDRGAQKLDEVLRYTPGVLAGAFGPDSDTDWIYIRGFDATQTGIFLDGLQLFQYAFAGFIVDPFLLERVEVLRGPASVLYGGSNAGGIVNSVSKRADGTRHAYVEGGLTDDPNGYLGVDLGNRFSEDSPWSYRVVGRVKGGDTQTDYADNIRGVIAPSLHFAPDADTSLDIYATYQADEQRHTNGFFPYAGTVTQEAFGRIPRSLYTNEPDLDQFSARQATLGYDLEHRVDETLTLRSNTRYADVTRSEYGPYLFGYYDAASGFGGFAEPVNGLAALNRLNFFHDTQAGLFTTDNQAEIHLDTGPLEHTLLAGIDYKNYRISQVQAVGSAPPLDIVNPFYSNTLSPLFAPYLDEKVELNQLGLYAQDQIKFGGGWILTLNGRHDTVWIDRDDRSAGDNDYDGNDDALSGRAGLGYEFANGIVPYVSVSRFFNPQIGTDANGNAVKPQEGEQYEVGVKYAPTDIDVVVTASLFDLTRRNTLQSDANFVPRAVGEIRSRGVELEAKANLTDDWNVVGSFTAYDLEIREDANPAIVGNQPFLVPEVIGSLWLNYEVPTGQLEGVELGGGIRYIGSSYADNENKLKVPDATVFDARIAYEKDDWGVSLNVNNVFDKRYVAGCQGVLTCGYAEGRSGLLKAHVKF
jgi:iron complex outermembrane receptor protein